MTIIAKIVYPTPYVEVVGRNGRIEVLIKLYKDGGITIPDTEGDVYLSPFEYTKYADLIAQGSSMLKDLP